MDSRNQAKWIWLPGYTDYDDELPGKFVLFRRTLDLQENPTTACNLHVSADTRYRLFVNGTSVAFGPCKSYPSRWYYETIDVSPYLRSGINIITAKVLRFFPSQIGSSSMMKANVPGFIVWGEINNVPFITDEKWLCCEEESIRLQSRSEWNYILGPPFLSLDERVDFSKSRSDWQQESVDQSKWSNAVPAVTPIKMMPVLEPWKLFERPIPSLPETPRHFRCALKCSDDTTLSFWSHLLCQQKPVSIASHQSVFVEFESTVLTTGFLELDLVGGAGAEVSILYAESYEKDLGVDKSPFPRPRSKGDRRDWKHGRLYGTEDHITLAAKDGQPTRYEPFWFRTFRFIRLTVTTKAAPVTMQRIAFRETHYPLQITTQISLPPSLQSVWDISVNTLRNCMHETYEDCPFYEQNQFAMDGRLQMLFTYQLSRDDRLARKTIHEFHASRLDSGLLETNFPVSFRAINIPQFSLFWILMLHDHMMYFNDAALVRRYMPTADGILEYFDTLLTSDGLVGAFDAECWAFVDWVKEWQGSKGIRDMAVPPIYKRTGVATYNTLLYAWVLQHAADLATFIARPDTAQTYLDRSSNLTSAAYLHCFDTTTGLFLDGTRAAATANPDLGPCISEHTQIFAVLSGAIIGAPATHLMHTTLTHPSLPRCSFAMKHYVFRALETTGLYTSYFSHVLAPWRAMVAQNLTTCAEDDVSARSDCHGWSAGVIYELVAAVYGIRPKKENPGFGVVRVDLSNVDLLAEQEDDGNGSGGDGDDDDGGSGDGSDRPRWDAGTVRYDLGRGWVKVGWDRERGADVQASVDVEVEVVSSSGPDADGKTDAAPGSGVGVVGGEHAQSRVDEQWEIVSK